MLDENLPTFLLRPSSDKPRQNLSLLFSQHGSEFEPKYAVRHPDPDQHGSRNRYAVALSDAYNPDILYAEVLLIPEWTQPTVHPDQRGPGTVGLPRPEPVLPDKFVIQLYNPDQQVVVRHKPASWNSAAAWEFELPQQTFRAPSASVLDRSQHDPAGSEITPRIGFKWKKDSKLSKDLACFLSGKVVNPDGSKKKSKEPDITVAIFRALKELTLYEPNLTRVDVEDAKGLEVVLALGAIVIRDVYFGSMKDAFNLHAGPKPNIASPRLAAAVPTSGGVPVSQSLPATGGHDSRVPPTDPRSQWEIDEEERAERRRRQAEIDRETERLKRLYGAPPTIPPRHYLEPQHGPLNATSGQALRLKNKSSIFSFRRNSNQDSK
ncbi:hypothetical protein DV735_g2186, partial [Chaetothyriales sp. CBS 134920]